jgi:hypothetical protein
MGLLNPACSAFLGLFVMAAMAPDFSSFFAFSFASLASKGLLGAIALSGSGLGAFSAWSAFL